MRPSPNSSALPPRETGRRRGRGALALLAALALILGAAPAALASPVAGSDPEYTALGRIFPDPHGCRDGLPASSPYAKGLVCATDFLQFAELEKGMAFLEQSFPKFVETFTLHQDFNCNGKRVKNADDACQAFRSAGLPNTLPDGQSAGFSRDRRPLYMIQITDERVSNAKKKWFAFPLSIHGIERAGAEGGTRAAEDLATWGACEAKVAPDYVDCEHPDNVAPHALLESTPKRSITAGEALRKSVVVFIYPNPDGWVRGERTEGTQSFQRYNGNGVDLNRDWPTQGFTYRPYTPWSEPESRAFGRVLQGHGPTDAAGDPNWTGGIDLHGQLIDRAFSFTLMGASERPFDKNQRILQTVKGAWKDAEARLAWSPVIKPNDAPGDDPRLYGVQWGTVWDSIAYTVTGSFGDWIDSPIGLGADGIDNEMSLSHVSNCGIGSCWENDVEQLHVDGNKSLIYSMIHYSLKRENTTFATQGKVAYVHNRGTVSEEANRDEIPPRFASLPPQEDIPSFNLTEAEGFERRFSVKGPRDDVYNGGIVVTITCANAQGVSPCALTTASLQRKSSKAHRDHAEGEWETVNSYFNQSPIYVQGGQALHANLPTPGRWRVIIEGANSTDIFTVSVDFTREKGWPDPGQIGYRATNMNFWKDLKPFTKPGLEKVTAGEIRKTNGWRSRYDTIVVTDAVYKDLANDLKSYARSGGNVVLTDAALEMLPSMGLVSKDDVGSGKFYAGYVNFATADKEVTYNDPLAKQINAPGAAEGMSGDEVHRRQTYEPVPINYAIQNASGDDADNSPVWFVNASALKKVKGSRAVGTSGSTNQVSYGEIKLGKGRIRFLGAVLPMPTDEFDNPFGVADYSLTYSGYQLLKNMLTWHR